MPPSGDDSCPSSFSTCSRATTIAKPSGAGTKQFRHPLVGDLTLAYEGLEVLGDAGLAMVTYSAEPGSRSEEAMRELARWSSTRDRLAALGTGSEV